MTPLPLPPILPRWAFACGVLGMIALLFDLLLRHDWTGLLCIALIVVCVVGSEPTLEQITKDRP